MARVYLARIRRRTASPTISRGYAASANDGDGMISGGRGLPSPYMHSLLIDPLNICYHFSTNATRLNPLGDQLDSYDSPTGGGEP